MASPRRPVANNSAELHNDGRDMAYLVDVELGSQGQKLKMVVDTGSSDTWVYGQACEKKACLAHTRYDHSLSSDFKEEDLPFTVHYGTGDSKGNFVTDRMKVGDFDFVTKFGIISEASDVFIGFPLDGILALGFNNVSMSGQPGFLEELYSNKLIDRRTFGLALSKTNESIHDGVINFGGYDPTYFNGDLQFRNVTNQNMAAYWQVPVEEIKHNDQVINKHGKHGILDSGTSMMVAPYWDASHLHSGIPGALTNGNSFQVPCSTKDTMELKLNGISFKLMPEDWIGKPVAGSKDACISLISGHKVEHEAYLGKTTWLLGAAFMRNAYVYFDVDNMRIGKCCTLHDKILSHADLSV
ncbi:acid protease [Ascobolus immersus RN42]|uniref:Acid protease n=1 Tax=Ascobolus immersus RN42 TaxID=1160509 RepID=A0A3N4HNX1_ASCIM|nr:acid protease [Ascobolus immersus RN42]